MTRKDCLATLDIPMHEALGKGVLRSGARNSFERALLARLELTSFLRAAPSLYAGLERTTGCRAWWFAHRVWGVGTGMTEGACATGVPDTGHDMDPPTWAQEPWRALRSGRESDPYNSGYLPADPAIGSELLSRVAGPEKYTFLDLGCGKGRVLVLATEVGFRRVIGVEINHGLAEIARRNAAKIRAEFPERVPIEVLHDDAAAVGFPLEPLIIFLNHPFWGPAMRQVSRNLMESLTAAPREAIIFYVNPVLSEIFDAVPLLERVCTDTTDARDERVADYIIWRTRMPCPDVCPMGVPDSRRA